MDFDDLLDEPVQEQMQVQWWESAPRDNVGALWEDCIHKHVRTQPSQVGNCAASQVHVKVTNFKYESKNYKNT